MISCKEEFTVKKIDDNTFQITDYFHDHMYLLLGHHLAMLIDTGAGSLHLCQCIRELTSLPLMVCLTHGHVDHIGCADLEQTVYLSAEDHSLFHAHLSSSVRSSYLETKAAAYRGNMSVHQCNDYIHLLCKRPIHSSLQSFPSEFIELGGRKLQVILSPGHTKGSVCFYEKATGYLFSGDTICDQGVLLGFPESADIRTYHAATRTLSALSVKHIFCGHHQGMIDPGYIKEYQILSRLILEHKIHPQVSSPDEQACYHFERIYVKM